MTHESPLPDPEEPKSNRRTLLFLAALALSSVTIIGYKGYKELTNQNQGVTYDNSQNAELDQTSSPDSLSTPLSKNDNDPFSLTQNPENTPPKYLEISSTEFSSTEIIPIITTLTTTPVKMSKGGELNVGTLHATTLPGGYVFLDRRLLSGGTQIIDRSEKINRSVINIIKYNGNLNFNYESPVGDAKFSPQDAVLFNFGSENNPGDNTFSVIFPARNTQPSETIVLSKDTPILDFAVVKSFGKNEDGETVSDDKIVIIQKVDGFADAYIYDTKDLIGGARKGKKLPELDAITKPFRIGSVGGDTSLDFGKVKEIILRTNNDGYNGGYMFWTNANGDLVTTAFPTEEDPKNKTKLFESIYKPLEVSSIERIDGSDNGGDLMLRINKGINFSLVISGLWNNYDENIKVTLAQPLSYLSKLIKEVGVPGDGVEASYFYKNGTYYIAFSWHNGTSFIQQILTMSNDNGKVLIKEIIANANTKFPSNTYDILSTNLSAVKVNNDGTIQTWSSVLVQNQLTGEYSTVAMKWTLDNQQF